MASGWIVQKVRGGVKIYPSMSIGNELITFGIGNATFTIDPMTQKLPNELRVIMSSDANGRLDFDSFIEVHNSLDISASSYVTRSVDIGGGNIVTYKELVGAEAVNSAGKYECSGTVVGDSAPTTKIFW